MKNTIFSRFLFVYDIYFWGQTISIIKRNKLEECHFILYSRYFSLSNFEQTQRSTLNMLFLLFFYATHAIPPTPTPLKHHKHQKHSHIHI